LTCPACGLKYAAFRADGRLGCPDDYDAFRPALEPLLERIHRGTRHGGKAPRAAALRAELSELRGQLAAAVEAENYEDAAELRDRIRQKEAQV
jgi:protein arginine kinase activator